MGGKTGSTGAEHVEASMAVMSMAEDSASGSLAESIPNPAKNYVQSVEPEMDENKAVKHKHRDSTAEGVTPSYPLAITHLFQEMESQGSANLGPDDSETGSTTGEGEESDHLQTGVATGAHPPLKDGSGSTATKGSETEAETFDGTDTPKSHHSGAGKVVTKLWGRTKPDTPNSSTTTNGACYNDFAPTADGPNESAQQQVGDALPRPYWPPEDESGLPMIRSQDGSILQRPPPSSSEAEMTEPPPAIPLHYSVQRLPVGASGSEVGQASAPLRRKSSMGSFQKGMGESLTGRMRKQLDIPPEPKAEICLNIPIDQLQSLEYLAQGAMCVAYTALLNGKQVVLKTPLPDTSHADVAANDLEVEMLLLKELHHDNIVSLLGAGFLPDKRLFVALEYLSGGTLSTRLKDQANMPLGISKVLDWSLALCNALEYLHDVAVPGRIVCHRDLKPDNIGFAADGTLKLIDFGLGKIIKRKFRVRADSYQMTGGTGSLRYMAPEVADHQKYNEKADVYSFSLIMWEMLAGVKPFLGLKRPDFYTRVVDQGERPELDPAWPEPVRNLLESCWRTNLDERLSFREVAGILKVCAEEENRRLYLSNDDRRKSARLPIRRPRLWTTTGANPDLDEISRDTQYKPKFNISSFFTQHGRNGGVAPASGSTRAVEKADKKNFRRPTR